MTFTESNHTISNALCSGELSRPACYPSNGLDLFRTEMNISLNVLVTRGLRTVRLLDDLDMDSYLDDSDMVCFGYLPPPVDPTCLPCWNGRVAFVPTIDVSAGKLYLEVIFLDGSESFEGPTDGPLELDRLLHYLDRGVPWADSGL